jgi:hypothetical protein
LPAGARRLEEAPRSRRDINACVRRYYTQFFSDFMAKVAGYELLDEWVNERSVVQEYDITLEVDRARETHRVVGVLYAQGERLGGERIYGSERAVRRMAGCLFDELEPIAPGAGG